MKRATMLVSIICLGLFGPPGFADTLQLHCTVASDCTAGSTTLIDNSALPTFDLISTSAHLLTGTAFLAVLTPNGTGNFDVSIGGGAPIAAEETATMVFNDELGTVLNEGSGMNDFHFSSFANGSADAGVTATSYTVYEYRLGAFSGSGGTSGLSGAITVGGANLPTGTVIVGWLEDGSGHVTDQTPLSESAAITVGNTSVPEPSFLGVGILGLCLFAVRRFRKATP